MPDNFRQKRTPRKPFRIAVEVAQNIWETHSLSVRKNRALRSWRVLRGTKFSGHVTKFLQPTEQA